MKTTFLNKKIRIISPLPKPNQVWFNHTNQDLFKVLQVGDLHNNPVAVCEKENGYRFSMGYSYFDGYTNLYIGTLDS